MRRIYGNKEYRRTFYKDDAPEGYKGGPVEFVVPRDVFFGESQEEADKKARDEAEAKGQAYANERGGLIPIIFYNSKVCAKFTKDDCESGVGSEEEICVEPGRFVSYTSEDDANESARVYLDTIGQSEANAIGICCRDYLSRPFRGEFYKNDCPAGQDSESPYVYELPAGAEKSFVSQMEADRAAEKRFYEEGQRLANENGTCSKVYYNRMVGDWFNKECKFGYKSEPVYYSIEAGRFGSFVSEEAATEIAMSVLAKEGTQYAIDNCECVKYIENIDQEDNCFW